jgi:hypothetical protein
VGKYKGPRCDACYNPLPLKGQTRCARCQEHAFVVKVQAELAYTPEEGQQFMIYDEHEHLLETFPMNEGVASKLADRLKAYFWAWRKGTLIVLGEEAPEQDW